MVPNWVAQWLDECDVKLPATQLAFLRDVDAYLPGSFVWRDESGRRFDGLSLEGPADAPRVVIYLRSPRRPKLLLAFEYRLGVSEGMDDWAVLISNLMEDLDEAGSELPTQPGDDGVARF